MASATHSRQGVSMTVGTTTEIRFPTALRLSLPDDTANSPGLGFRTETPGPESDLIQEALQHRLPTDSRLARILFREPRLLTGYPDIVAAYPTLRTIPVSERRCDLRASHVQVAHQVHLLRTVRLERLADLLQLRVRVLEVLVEDLVAAGLLMQRGKTLQLQALDRVFALKRIVAIEAKISDWRAALQQAAANLWFASHSYVLLPRRRSYSAITASASRLGVGVLSLQDSKLTCCYPLLGTHPHLVRLLAVNEWVMATNS